MRHLYDTDVTIQRKTLTRDANGQPVETWADYLTIRAFVAQVSGEKRFQSGKDGHFSTHLMKCNVYDITESDRAVFSENTHEIMNVNQPNGADFLQIDVRRAE